MMPKAARKLSTSHGIYYIYTVYARASRKNKTWRRQPSNAIFANGQLKQKDLAQYARCRMEYWNIL
jgi:hypothetical protein